MKGWLFPLLLALLCAGACTPATSFRPSLSTAPIAQTSSQSPATAAAMETRATIGVTSLPPASVFSEIDMMDRTSGWAWGLDSTGHRLLLRTSEGGRTWMTVTPAGDVSQMYPPYSAYLLDAETAWVIRADDSLVRTVDGGQTWAILNRDLKTEMVVPFHDWYLLRFADADHGWLDAGYSAAGAHDLYYETRDGGRTWNPMDFESWPADLTAHRDYPNELAWWTMIDAIYYDSTRFIIAPGEQEGILRMFLSTDRGQSWKTVPLLPSLFPGLSFNPLDRKISEPTFFDALNGVITVSILDRNTNTTRFFVYGTSDGGLTWALTGGPSPIRDVQSAVSFIDPRDAVLVCGSKLCVTSDEGNTWQALDFGASISVDNVNTFSQLDFVDPMTGWLLVKTVGPQGARDSSRLLSTTDGGRTWTELALSVHP